MIEKLELKIEWERLKSLFKKINDLKNKRKEKRLIEK